MPQMTVLEILNRTKVFFEKKGIPDARLDAEYIISLGLQMKSRMDIYLNFEKPLTDAELDVLRQMVARRANREPLQHIIGDTSFRGFIIKCDKRALVPRPETEMLVDMAKERLKGIEAPFIVEVGTGTGAISIACAKEIAGAKVLATDISEDALALARENAEINELGSNTEGSNLTFAQGDLLDAVTGEALRQAQCPCDAKIDCLIANLPYIPDSEKGKLQPEVDKFDPALALYGGPDGLSLVRKLLQQTEGKLNAGASILLEIGSEQAEVLKNEAANFPWLEFAGIHKDYCGNIRFVSYKSK
ncbi:peptide chain release factor N(5)-glutamine methyltransferase [Fibrobacter sp.]|uniref:peptide chain release factor N(5)-glutamine methyltransferase n=2 Tax=Fibrobacter sp. TaxID=35828 RepID=UPI0025CE9826|nr:peptide chain release factor N(5)-glutamine methyltransferase [Fibrobacter sp.]MCI6438491.1 peptide chain release factor N(5)-glutamine methyltransferase [Fibrobacter sp.]MDY5724211.1 peptide chain release factor N(5)-glutamine methyltransferase [Fibrobacter sp.]